MANFGDFQNGVYAEAVRGVNSRYPFDFSSIERKAAEALPDWVYRYVSAAAGDGRTQRANIAAFSCYGIVPRMMVSPPQRDLSIQLFGEHLVSPLFLCPIGLVGLCAPDFHGDVAAAQASACTGVPYTLSTFSQTPMEDVIKHAGETPSFFQLYLPSDRELAASLINRAETSGYSALVVTVDSWTLGFRPRDLERGNFPQFRGYCMQNYYTDENFTKHLAKPPAEDQPAALAHYQKIFAHPLSWEDLRWIRTQTKLPIAVKGIQHPTTRAWRSTTVPTCFTALITVDVRQIRRFPRCSCCPGSSKRLVPRRSCSTPACARRPTRLSRWRWGRPPSGLVARTPTQCLTAARKV
jgi:lactate 2-monooxygenase